MTFIKTLLAVVILPLFIAGCREKDELTLPVRIQLKVGISPGTGNWDEGCMIGIRKIIFEGKREAGGDVFFEAYPDADLPLNDFSKLAAISDFDLPQGVYDYMKWDIYLKELDIDTSDYNQILDSLSIGIAIKGIYSGIIFNEMTWEEDTVNIPFIIAVDDMEQFSARSINTEANSRIVLAAGRDYEAVLSLNLPYAFSSLSFDAINNAERSGDSLNQKIVISRNKNKDLYAIILNRLETSAAVLFR